MIKKKTGKNEVKERVKVSPKEMRKKKLRKRRRKRRKREKWKSEEVM